MKRKQLINNVQKKLQIKFKTLPITLIKKENAAIYFIMK